MRASLLIKTAAAVAATALLLSACGSDDGGGGGTGTTTGGGEGGTANDATLRVNFGEFPENWTPGQEMEGGPLRVVYETLLAPGDDGPEPFLATAYELTDTDMTLTLREGVTFHDGEPFDAEAVKVNVETVQAGATAWAGTLAVISSIDVVDEYTVRLNLSGPTPSLPQTLTTRVLPIASPAAIEDGSIVQNPVGTSPWAYDASSSVIGTRMFFGAFENYWGETPGFANVELYAIAEDESAAAALVSGEIDVSDVEQESLPTFEGTAIETLDYPAIRNNVFFFDRGAGGIFENLEVRQAFCSAINVDQMIQVTGEGESGIQFFVEGEVGYNPDIEGYPFDLDAAQAFFAAAGNPSIDTEMVSAPYNNQQIEIFMTQVAELGDVNVTVTQLSPPEYNGTWNSGRYPLGLSSNDELTAFDWYRAWFAADAPGNPAGTESGELEAAAAAAIAAGDSDEADDLWGEVTKIITEEALTCAFTRGVEIIAWNSETVSNVAAPAEKWEPNLVNFRDLVPAGA